MCVIISYYYKGSICIIYTCTVCQIDVEDARSCDRIFSVSVYCNKCC